MKYIVPFLILLSFLLSGCHDYDKRKWVEYQGKGILEEDASFTILKFKDDSVGYIGGRQSHYEPTLSGESETQYNFTTIYKTKDQGRTWKKLNVNYEGEIRNLRFSGDSILALNQFLYSPPSILLSVDNGTTWKEILAFPKDTYIRDFNTYKGGAILVALDDKKYLNLLKISESVDTLNKFSKYHYKVAIGKENIFFVNPSGGVNSNGVIKYNFNSKNEEFIEFANTCYVQSLYLNDYDKLYLTAEDTDGNGKVLIHLGGNFIQLKLGDYATYSLGQLYVTGNKIIINANKKENVSPIGVTHEILVSEDSGITWHAENYPFPLIVSPADILTDGKFISYQGLGTFQKRK